ncbi:hypothetical protein LCGC14_1046240 [marine sediment metagenome]|uniref:Uncharacterized protein n=1 Tax=marine sediment metagenome TaxID=412755 RepID=A0A0F9QWC9_9ZZZZ
MDDIFFATLWPPAKKYFEAIRKDVEEHYTVKQQDFYKLGKREFKRFMFKMYKPDKTPQSRINKKYRAMSKHGQNISILHIVVPDPTMQPHKKTRLKGTFYCLEMKRLKRKIRSVWAPKIKGYVYDIVMHINDNEKHNIRTLRLLKKYAKKIN